MEADLDKLRAAVRDNPGAPEFVELAERLVVDDATRTEAREILFRGLAAEPANLLGRLVLAKSFYLDRMTSFCARELSELRARTETPALLRLCDAFKEYLPDAVSANPSGLSEALLSGDREVEDEVFGELEIDADFEDAEDELS